MTFANIPLQTSCPRICPLDADIILNVHTGLKKGGMGVDVPYFSLGYFLQICHDRVKAGYNTDMAVREALRETEVHNDHFGFHPIWTAPKDEGWSPDLVPILSSARFTMERD